MDIARSIDGEDEQEFVLFSDSDHAVYHGDALQVLDEKVPDGSVELIFADPPYNLGKRFGSFRDRWESEGHYVRWCESWIDLCIRKLSASGSLYLMASTQAMPFLDLYVRTRLTVLSRIIWAYDSSGVQARSRFGSMYEPILHCVVDPKRYTFNSGDIAVPARTGAQRRLIDYRRKEPRVYNTTKVPGNVWNIPRVRFRMPEYEEHPSQKPEALLERIVLASSCPGDLVLDPFAGTFTTAAVAKRLGRRSLSIEREEQFVKIGLRRLQLANQFRGEELQAPSKSRARRARRKGVEYIQAGLLPD